MTKQKERREVIDKGLFDNFIKELISTYDNIIDDICHCPFNRREDDWRDHNGNWRPPSFCDVKFFTDYEGVTDEECSGSPAKCWVEYLKRSFGIK